MSKYIILIYNMPLSVIICHQFPEATRLPLDVCRQYDLQNLYHNACNSLHVMGFKVIAVCCDGASTNRAWQHREFVYRVHESDPFPVYAQHVTTKEPIFWISDPSHAIKKTVNNLESSATNGVSHSIRVNLKPLTYCILP